MKHYVGTPVAGEAIVTVDGQSLDPRFDLRCHSPNGFEWGYAGSGPAKLALAILADHCGELPEALDHYQEFKFAVVTRLKRDGWKLTSSEIQRSMDALRFAQAQTPAPSRIKKEEWS